MKLKNTQLIWLPGMETPETETQNSKPKPASKKKKSDQVPENLGKAIRLPVPDFSDPNRALTCLEVDFPIAQINALSNLEGNAGKPIYQMSKWWARRRSSVFRSMLIAAATQAPTDPTEAAKRVWEHYYCNHQKAGSFKKLRVLDCFMGGGTTLVEGSRLGMQMTGVDLNPVAWFVVKNELACSDPEQVKALFDHIEAEVKPLIQPFYTTACPRGHQGKWIDIRTGQTADADPLELPPQERKHYRWEGPEIIYTFWAKHGPCQAKGCGHRTPVFRSPVIAEKKLSTHFIECVCPGCGLTFDAELGETRMAPGVERIVAESEKPFTEMTQPFARLLKDYNKGNADDTTPRMNAILEKMDAEPGLKCPSCKTFSGKKLADAVREHAKPLTRVSQRKKKDFRIQSKPVQMFLLIHPDWLKGAQGFENGKELGGYAGAPPEDAAAWYEKRLLHLALVEVRGHTLPDVVELSDGVRVDTKQGTVPRKGKYTCAHCGREDSFFNSARHSNKTLPIAAYTHQCYCPHCKSEDYNYGGRYFKKPEIEDINRLNKSEYEWQKLSETCLKEYWPRQNIPFGERTYQRDKIQDWGYTHWWKMFNSRQLLVHSQLLKSITEAQQCQWSIDVEEAVLGAFQQYLRNQNMFSFWDISRDCMAPSLSNSNFYPKNLLIENCIFNNLGRGNWLSNTLNTIAGLKWANNPWECVLLPEIEKLKSKREELNDPVIAGEELCCGSSTDLSILSINEKFDLVITDPPFGDNLFYADLADFFYVWLRIPLRKWYADLPEAAYFEAEHTPRSMEAVDNPVEHPDDREPYEKSPFIDNKHLEKIRAMIGDDSLDVNYPNPLYRPEPSSEFYSQTLSACWAEAGRLLKDGGIMAFTFHHSQDQAWIDVLKALFDAGYVLIQTYPIRSDETKGEHASFGSQSIEYDIIHVCRKRLETIELVSWSRMRRWVKDETARLKTLLEHTHGKELPESDLRVILRGKSLEFYSRHYGQVYTGDGQILDVRNALLGINQLLDDLLEDTSQTAGMSPPDSAEPVSRLFLRIFANKTELPRDELHKTLRGTGISQGDLEYRGWIRVIGKVVCATPVPERFAAFTERGRNRKNIKSDLDQAHFLIGAAIPNSGVKIETELNNPNFRIKKSTDDILKWVAAVEKNAEVRQATQTALRLVENWRTRKERPPHVQSTLFENLEAYEYGVQK